MNTEKQETKSHKMGEQSKPLNLEIISLISLKKKTRCELQELILKNEVKFSPQVKKDQLIWRLLQDYHVKGHLIKGAGVLDISKNQQSTLIDLEDGLKSSMLDLHLPLALCKENRLKSGLMLKVYVEPKFRSKIRSLVVTKILEIEGTPVNSYENLKSFNQLTAVFPDQRFVLENLELNSMSNRVIDLVAPLGRGQRGLIVAPPRGGKTVILKQIAKAIEENYDDIELLVLLVDERPEEVSDFEDSIKSKVFASTFDESPKAHTQLADLVLAYSKRLVEQGKHVVLLLDSLTRMARGHNSAQKGGPIGSGGLSPIALERARKFFGSARNVENGGSLTILATVLIGTESRMDEVIFEEFKGTGNMEVVLDQQLAEQRMFPAIHISKSGTRNDERLYHVDEFEKVIALRRHLVQMPIGEAIEELLKLINKTSNNAELVLAGL